MKFIELFAGIGGFRYGLEKIRLNESLLEQPKNSRSIESWRGHSKFTCVWSNEIDKYACQIYRKNFGEGELYEGDITKVNTDDIPDFDLLTGGFPCQSFSIAGKRGGFEDTRGSLFFEIARIAQEKQPRLLLLENVKGLLSHDKGRTFGTILSTLDEVGYDCQWQVLNSKNFGVPQNRERVFIIGHLRGTSRPKVFPIRESGKEGDGKLGLQRTRQIARSLRATDYKGTHNNIREEGIRIRRLTPIECERLQSFPDGWTEGVSDTQRYKALGNAVTTNVITEIGRSLK